MTATRKTGLTDCDDPDAPLSEKEAIATGLILVDTYKPTSGSDFDKGMRILQAALRKPKTKPVTKAVKS